MCGRPSQLSVSGRETLPDVRGWWEALLDVQEALPDVREWSGHPTGCPGVVGKPSRMFGSGQEALPVVREWTGDPSECLGCPPRYPGVVGGPL